ncbi:MAG: ribonucleotide reductase N-terminal alpha domain-containing protein, partial [Candidatus Nanoarchaeia archaeon]
MNVSKIYKRNGRLVNFEPRKIVVAIDRSFQATKTGSRKQANLLTDFVISILEKKFAKRPPSVEDVQDVVERVLIHNRFTEAAKAYIIYRQRHSEIRETKKLFVPKGELDLSLNALQIVRKRYLLKDDEGKIIESPMQMFRRVSKHVSKGERSKRSAEEAEKIFYRMMSDLEFLPNSPTLMNADTRIGQLSACFVLPVKDSMKDIFTSLKNMALIHQSGGGTGFSFSRLRPEGDFVGSTKGVASGPVSFMTIYDKATDVIKQGGRRRGANMGILRVDHPDIINFITAKKDHDVLRNFNISVAVTDRFMQAVEHGGYFDLISPHTDKAVTKIKAREIFDLIVTMAWQTGDPGLIFIDEINRKNPVPALGDIEST